MTEPAREPIGWVLGRGGWRGCLERRLRRFPRPVLACGDSRLYRVYLEGSGFVLPIEGGESMTGFFVTQWVAASSTAEATTRARRALHRQWRGRGLHIATGGLPVVRIREVERTSTRFRWRRATGFLFWSDAGEE
jgi:hypothetical protein